jgi:hypothetical protein
MRCEFDRSGARLGGSEEASLRVRASLQGDGRALTAPSAASVDHSRQRLPLRLAMTNGFTRYQACFSKI